MINKIKSNIEEGLNTFVINSKRNEFTFYHSNIGIINFNRGNIKILNVLDLDNNIEEEEYIDIEFITSTEYLKLQLLMIEGENVFSEEGEESSTILYVIYYNKTKEIFVQFYPDKLFTRKSLNDSIIMKITIDDDSL